MRNAERPPEATRNMSRFYVVDIIRFCQFSGGCTRPTTHGLIGPSGPVGGFCQEHADMEGARLNRLELRHLTPHL